VKQGRHLAWNSLMRLDQGRFMRQAQLAYAQARYMLFYMHEKGLLKKFYDEYTAKENYARDRSARDSFEVVFGKPLEVVEQDWREWILEQKVPPVPFLGVQTRQEKERLVVVQVTPGSGAAKAGIKARDAITAVDGRPIASQGDLLGAIAEREPGEQVEIEVARGKEKLTLTATLGKRSDLAALTRRAAKRAPYLGLTVEERDKRVVIKEVAKDSPAAKAGLKPGDVIVEFDGKKLDSVRAYLAALRAAKPGKQVTIKIKQGDQVRSATVTLTELPG
jgi:serine protease Do